MVVLLHAFPAWALLVSATVGVLSVLALLILLVSSLWQFRMSARQASQYLEWSADGKVWLHTRDARAQITLQPDVVDFDCMLAIRWLDLGSKMTGGSVVVFRWGCAASTWQALRSHVRWRRGDF